MKVIGLEEHFATPDLVEAWRRLEPEWRDVSSAVAVDEEKERRLLDLGAGRIAAMDEAGVDVQVLSVTTPGVQNLARDEALAIQASSNDRLAEAIRAHPDRFQGLAALATPAPVEAARELERAVKSLGMSGAILCGRTRDRNLDHADFWPIFEAAEALRAPLYLHPQSPRPAVREAYYGGFGDAIDASFATFGIGWHYETGVQLLRLIFAGVFDRFPGLQVVTGHWGEVVLFYLERLERLASARKLKLPLGEYFRQNISITPSGMYSPRYMRWAIEVVGADRILFSTDYPYVPPPPGGVRAFLESADLGELDRAKIAHGNWEKLVANIRR